MIYFQLFKEFFTIGVLSFGGGFATLPFLYNIAEKYHWYSVNELTQMLAISSITPGPVGLNMATYAGMQIRGIITALIASLAIITPAFFIVIGISKLLKKFSDNFYVKAAIYGLKPASCALIASVAIKLIKSTVSDLYATILFTCLSVIFLIRKQSPLFYLITSGIAGILFVFIMVKV